MWEDILNWIRSSVDKALIDFSVSGVQIKRKYSGPSVMLVLKTARDEMSVDFVPVLKFTHLDCPTWPPRAWKKFPPTIPVDKQFWFMVPKRSKNPNYTAAEISVMWRLDFPEIEKVLIHDVGCLKLVVKLLKLLRDARGNWNCIASYHLKTLAMLELVENPNIIWRESNLGWLFMFLLGRLEYRLSQHHMPFLFYRDANLFEGRVPKETAANIAGQIKRLIVQIRKDPSQLSKLF
ncbi:Uncharacterised protein r2_g429 [Pycnogonum litorale]